MKHKALLNLSYFSIKQLLTLLIFLVSVYRGISQTRDTTASEIRFSGQLGLTNNGISIIPSFTLNAPSTVFILSFGGKRFSIDPDIRLTLDGKKGGGLLWFRYKVITGKKFSLGAGVHPAYNFAIRQFTENNTVQKITQARRFIASEIVPYYQVSEHFGTGIYYLQGHGLQKDGPMQTHFVALNANISGLRFLQHYFFQIVPQLYYLNIDKVDGTYFSANAAISHDKIPFSLHSTINKVIDTRIAGSEDFMWNVTLFYNFSKKFRKVN